ncbi:MAG TPA: amino acid ABC transporter substrate-binding protein [Usitatibacter sp.]|jgi:glutamate/aspartate transport system substrate-binding protein|nr:amino acid ABC transporter substrate-binding protein [Usitatibacter sp.]
MLRFTRAAVAAVACALIAAPALAQQGTLEKIKSSGAITIGHRDASIPFSYLDENQKPVGYAMDICQAVVEAVKKKLGMPNLKVNYQLVTSANRIPLISNGTIDMECGSTTNNLEREKQVSFGNTYFIPANRWAYKKSSNVPTLDSLKGKTIVSTAGTSNIKLVTQLNNEKNLGMNIISANGHPEAFQMVETGRAVAFVMDDILLAGLIANSRNPSDFTISKDFLSLEPYGPMIRKDDPDFQKVVDDATAELYKSPRMQALYDKWFLKPIPPKNITMNVPMSEQLKKALANPTHSGDPDVYK